MRTRHADVHQMLAHGCSIREIAAALGLSRNTVRRFARGAAEGRVNRIKMLKRKMYGRANSDLLRRRLLLAD